MTALPGDLAALFPDGGAGRALDVELPPGRLVSSEEEEGGPLLWLSDGEAPFGLWGRLRAAHAKSGLWPVLLDSLAPDEEFRPWGRGELEPSEMTDPAAHDPATVLAGFWADQAEPEPGEQPPSYLAPFGRTWPGLATAARSARDADDHAEEIAEVMQSREWRIGLFPATRGADVPTLAGWTGPLNHSNDTAPLSAVLRSWEDRFDARLVALGFAEVYLAVGAPPTTIEEARLVAAEHLAFCPDNVLQSDVGSVEEYAHLLLDRSDVWYFWWD